MDLPVNCGKISVSSSFIAFVSHLTSSLPPSPLLIVSILLPIYFLLFSLTHSSSVFATIGEVFEEPTVAGVVLAIRAKDDILSIWNSSNTKSADGRFLIADKLKKVLNLDVNTIIEYKAHRESLSDGSSFRNGKAYVVSSTES